MSGFHGAFATGVASQQGTLTLPDTWFRPPFWDLLMLQLLRPNSSNLPCLYSTFHLEYPLVLSRFYLHVWSRIKLPDRSRIKVAVPLITGNVTGVGVGVISNVIVVLYCVTGRIRKTHSLYWYESVNRWKYAGLW